MALQPKQGDTKKVNGKVYRYQKVKGKLQWVPISGVRKVIRKIAEITDTAPQTKYEFEHSQNKNKSAYQRKKTTGSTGLSNINPKEGNAVIKGRGGKAERLNPDYGVKGQPDKVVNENKRNQSSDSNKKKLKMHSIERKNREIFGDKRVDELKAKHAKWKADRKKAREERRKKRLKSKK